jgi:hypothetical protein
MNGKQARMLRQTSANNDEKRMLKSMPGDVRGALRTTHKKWCDVKLGRISFLSLVRETMMATAAPGGDWQPVCAVIDDAEVDK